MELLPLVRKELVELASQRRTYWIRAGYAVLSSAVVGFALWIVYQQTSDSFELLGAGRTLFEVVMWSAFIGIGVFLPALVANTFPAERESGAFDLLWLTRLTPGELIVEKLLSRLWPMLTLLLVGLPIGALTYSFGGVTQARMFGGAYLLVLFAFQVGAWSMIWAVCCKRAIPAFLAALASLVVVMFLGPVVVADTVSPAPFAPHYYFVAEGSGLAVLGRSAAGWLPVIACLVIARLILPRTVGTRPARRPQAETRARHIAAVPRDEPVAWRERHAVGLGGWVTGLIYFAFAVAVGAMVLTTGSQSIGSGFGATIMFSAWAITCLVAVVRGVSLVTTERANLTLDTLLTTSLTGGEIIRQKIRGLAPTVCALVGLLWLLAIANAWNEHTDRGAYRRWDDATYLLALCSLSVAYLPMYLHWGALVGLKVKTKLRALVVALVGVFVWIFGPAVFLAVVARDMGRDAAWMLYTSPPVAVVALEYREALVDRDQPIPELVFCVLWHVGILVVLRASCIAMADQWLGRVEHPLPAPHAEVDGPIDGPSERDGESRR